MNLAEMKQALHEMDQNLSEQDEVFGAGLVLLAAVDTGQTSVAPLQTTTGLPVNTVRKFVRNLKANGIFKDGKIYHSGWDDEESGGIAFWLDAAVAVGLVRRS